MKKFAMFFKRCVYNREQPEGLREQHASRFTMSQMWNDSFRFQAKLSGMSYGVRILGYSQ